MFDFVPQEKEELKRLHALNAADIAKLQVEKEELKLLHSIEIAKLKLDHDTKIKDLEGELERLSLHQVWIYPFFPSLLHLFILFFLYFSINLTTLYSFFPFILLSQLFAHLPQAHSRPSTQKGPLLLSLLTKSFPASMRPSLSTVRKSTLVKLWV